MEAPDFVYKIYPCELQLLFDILLLISAGTGILQALGNLPKLFGVLIMASGYSTWQKGAPTHKTGCWALLRCQTPRCKVALCEDSKEPLLLPLINSRENKGFRSLLPTSLLRQLSRTSAPERRKMQCWFSLNSHLLLQRSMGKGEFLLWRLLLLCSPLYWPPALQWAQDRLLKPQTK